LSIGYLLAILSSDTHLIMKVAFREKMKSHFSQKKKKKNKEEIGQGEMNTMHRQTTYKILIIAYFMYTLQRRATGEDLAAKHSKIERS
jgi:hypothetical protein